MGLSEAQILGMSENVQGLFKKERAALGRAGFDAEAMLTILETIHQEYIALNMQQEFLKRQLKATTKRLQALGKRLYHLASGYIDAARTAVQRGSPAAKNIQKLRSRIRIRDEPEQEVTPVEVPEP